MSSHHIVREKQEPALLVLGMDGFSDELLGQLLEWSPTVIVTPLMAEKLNAEGIKVDLIISNDVGDLVQSDAKLLPLQGASEDTAAMNYLVDDGYPSVNIVTDELDIENYTPFVDKINIVIFYAGQKICPVISGFKKWLPAGERIRIMSPVQNLSTTGLQREHEGSFMTNDDGVITLQFDGGFLWVAGEV